MTNRFIDSRLLGYLLSICIAVCVLVGWMAWEGRSSALERATIRADSLAEGLEQHAKAAVEVVDVVLHLIRQQLPNDLTVQRDGLRVHKMLRDRVEATPLIRELAILDTEGRMLFESGNHPPRAARGKLQNGLNLARPGREPLELAVAARDGAAQELVFSRRITRADGTIAGRLLAFVDASYFQRFHQHIDVGPNGAISLLAAEGTLLLRKPDGAPAGQRQEAGPKERSLKMATGNFESLSADGRVTWLNSFRRVEGLPLAVMVSVEEDHVLGSWRRDATRHAMLGFLIIGAVIGSGVFLWHQVGRREHAEGREKATRGDLEHKHAVIETILGTLPDGVCLFDSALNIAACNDQLFAILGLDRDEILGVAESGRAFREALAQRSGGSFSRLTTMQEVEAMTRSGGQYHGQLGDGRWIECRHTPVGATGYLSVYRDVTEATARETELRDAYAKAEQQSQRLAMAAEELGRARASAEQANLTKSRFLANMSHELRTPLNAINGFSEVIADLHLGREALDRYREYARDIHVSGQHLLELINGVLDLSKVEAGRMELREETVDLGATVHAAMKMVEAQAEEKQISLNLLTPPDPLLLRADSQKLLQCFLNVLSNGVKFTPPGGRVAATVSPSALGPVVVVTDTGIGIAPADMAKVFEPFAQIDSDLARDNAGTGLGMPLTRSLIELHGGAITLESTKGAGTTITMRLPRHRLVSVRPLARSA